MTRRKPTSQKLATGTYRPERDRSLAPVDADLMPPGYLGTDALRIWRLKAPGLQAEGLLTPLDLDNFALWCQLQSHVETCIREGSVPSRDTLTHYRGLSAAFGLNPDARSKLGHAGPRAPEPENPFAMLDRLHPNTR